MSAKIAVFDIETLPATAYTFGPKYEARLMKELTPIRLASFAYKELGKPAYCYTQADFKTYRELVKRLWELFDTYDILIAHNGKKFDVRQSNSFFLEEKLPPPSQYKIVDTLTIARKYFKLSSYSLKDLLVYLGLPNKMETGGEELWFACLRGEEKAWKIMKKYNKQDVITLELLYFKLLAWNENHPNVLLFERGSSIACPKCSSSDFTKRGFNQYTKGRRQSFLCRKCNGRFEDKKLIPR